MDSRNPENVPKKGIGRRWRRRTLIGTGAAAALLGIGTAAVLLGGAGERKAARGTPAALYTPPFPSATASGHPSESSASAHGKAETPTPEPSGKKCGTVSPILVPACGVLWGLYSVRGQTLTSSVTNVEQQVGRSFDVVMRFHDFSNRPGPGRFPDDSERELGERRLLFFAWESKDYAKGRSYKWADIAAGRFDDQVIKPVARQIKGYGRTVFMSFDPEMDRHMVEGERKGDEHSYVAAARHVHRVFAEAGVKNVVWAWVTTGSLGGGNDKRILNSYPGDGFVDWVGWDPYNFFHCKGSNWQTFEEKIKNQYRLFQSRGLGKKPFILPEYATQYDTADPGRSRRWYADIPGTLRRYPNIKGMIRFDAGPGCNLGVDNGPGMLKAFGAAGLAPSLRTGLQD